MKSTRQVGEAGSTGLQLHLTGILSTAKLNCIELLSICHTSMWANQSIACEIVNRPDCAQVETQKNGEKQVSLEEMQIKRKAKQQPSCLK